MANNSHQDTPQTANEVEAYLKDRKEGRVRLYEQKDGKMVIDHVRTANAMSMFVANTPMPKIFKQILIMRIGSPLIHKKPMTNMAIALHNGMRVEEVEEIEREALKICNEFMQRSTGSLVTGNDNKGLIIDTLNETVNTKG